MAIDITVRWSGPSDAVSGDTYTIDRSLNWADWSNVATDQAATSPYASPSSTLDTGGATYGDTTLDLVDASSFSASGYGTFDDVGFQWTGKSSNQLTGVTWITGYGTYSAGTTVREVHESVADNNITPTNKAVVYKIVRKDSSGNASAPTYFWHYDPGVPASGQHCRVIVQVFEDVGVAPRDTVAVTCQLVNEGDFSIPANLYLDPATATTAGSQDTNALGIATFDVWHSESRFAQAATSSYSFQVDDSAPYTVSIATIPARTHLFLGQLVA